MAKIYSWFLKNMEQDNGTFVPYYSYIVHPENTTQTYQGPELTGDDLETVKSWASNCTDEQYRTQFNSMVNACSSYNVTFEDVSNYLDVKSSCDNLTGKQGRGIYDVSVIDDKDTTYTKIQFTYDDGNKSRIISIRNGAKGQDGQDGAVPDKPVSSILVTIYRSGIDENGNLIEDMNNTKYLPYGGEYNFLDGSFDESTLNNRKWYTSNHSEYKNLQHPIWMSSSTFLSSINYENTDPIWSTPTQITGENGKPGADGINSEFIYCLAKEANTLTQVQPRYKKMVDSDDKTIIPDDTTNENTKSYRIEEGVIPSVPSEAPKNNEGLEYKYIKLETSSGIFDYYIWTEYESDYIPVGWADSPSGVTTSNPCEWVSTRRKDKKTQKWDKFKTPTIWSKYGEKGEDGDGVDYIYLSTNDPIPPENPTPKEYKTDENYQNKDTEWVPPIDKGYKNINDNFIEFTEAYRWLDDPQPVSQDNLYCWVACRKFRKDDETKTKIWGAFSTPSLWAKYGETGQSGTAIRKLFYLSQDDEYNAPDLPSDSLMTNGWSTGFPVNYTKGRDVVWATEAEIYIASNEFVQRYEIVSKVNTDANGDIVIDKPIDAVKGINTITLQEIPSTKEDGYDYIKIEVTDGVKYYEWDGSKYNERILTPFEEVYNNRPLDSIEYNNTTISKTDPSTLKSKNEQFDYLKYNNEYYAWLQTGDEDFKYHKLPLFTYIIEGVQESFPPQGVQEINSIEYNYLPNVEITNYKYVIYNEQYYNWKTTSWCEPFIVTGMKGDSGEPVAYSTFIFAYAPEYTINANGMPDGKPGIPVQTTVSDSYASAGGLKWEDYPDPTPDNKLDPDKYRIDGQVIKTNTGEFTYRWYQLVGSVDRSGKITWGEPTYANGLDGHDGITPEFRYAVTNDSNAPYVDREDREPIYSINGQQKGWFTTNAQFATLTIPKGGAMWQIWGKIDTKTNNLVSQWEGPVRISGEQGEPGLAGPTGLRGVSGIPGVSYKNRYCLGTWNKDDEDLNGHFGDEVIKDNLTVNVKKIETIDELPSEQDTTVKYIRVVNTYYQWNNSPDSGDPRYEALKIIPNDAVNSEDINYYNVFILPLITDGDFNIDNVEKKEGYEYVRYDNNYYRWDNNEKKYQPVTVSTENILHKDGYFGDKVEKETATANIPNWFSSPVAGTTLKIDIDLDQYTGTDINSYITEKCANEDRINKESNKGRVINAKCTYTQTAVREDKTEGNTYEITKYYYYVIKNAEKGNANKFELQTIISNSDTNYDGDFYVWCIQGEEKVSYTRTKEYRLISEKNRPNGVIEINVDETLTDKTKLPSIENALIKYYKIGDYYYQWNDSPSSGDPRYEVLVYGKPNDAVRNSDVNTEIVDRDPTTLQQTTYKYVKYKNNFYIWDNSISGFTEYKINGLSAIPKDAVCLNTKTVPVTEAISSLKEDIDYKYLRKEDNQNGYSYYNYYSWVDIPQNELDDEKEGYKIKVIEWGTPFRLSGANGLEFKGNRGQVVYPAGLYDMNKVYKCDEHKAPYVMDPNDQQFYVLDRVMTWVGKKPDDWEDEKYGGIYYGITDQGGNTPSKDFADAESVQGATPSWVKFEQFKAIYASVGIIANGMIGSAVFNNEFMFSQQGKAFPYKVENNIGRFDTTEPRVESSHYEGFLSAYSSVEDENGFNVWKINDDIVDDISVDPYHPSNAFHPNVCINFKTGQMWLSCGAIRLGAFASNGETESNKTNIPTQEYIDEWGDDNILTPSERLNLKEKYNTFLIEHEETNATADLFGLDEQNENDEYIYQEYSNFINSYNDAKISYEKHLTPTAKEVVDVPSTRDEIFYKYICYKGEYYECSKLLSNKKYKYNKLDNPESTYLDLKYLDDNETFDKDKTDYAYYYPYIKRGETYFQWIEEQDKPINVYEKVNFTPDYIVETRTQLNNILTKNDINNNVGKEIIIKVNSSLDGYPKGYYKKIGNNLERLEVTAHRYVPLEISTSYIVLLNSTTTDLGDLYVVTSKSENFFMRISEGTENQLEIRPFTINDNMTIYDDYSAISQYYINKTNLIIELNKEINNQITYSQSTADKAIQRLENIANDGVISKEEIRELETEKLSIEIESGTTYNSLDDFYGTLSVDSGTVTEFKNAAAKAVCALTFHIDGAKKHYEKHTSGYTITDITGTTQDNSYGWISEYYRQKGNLDNAVKKCQQIYTTGGINRLDAMGADNLISDIEIPMLEEEKSRILNEYAAITGSVSGLTALTNTLKDACNDYITGKTKAVCALTFHIDGAKKHYEDHTSGYTITDLTGITTNKSYGWISEYYRRKATLEKEAAIAQKLNSDKSISRLNSMSDDNVISDAEISSLKTIKQEITSEYDGIISAATAVSASSVDYQSAYNNAITALTHHICGATEYFSGGGTTGFTIVTGNTASSYTNIAKYYEEKAKLEYYIANAQKISIQKGIDRLNAMANDNVVTKEEIRFLKEEKDKIIAETGNTYSQATELSAINNSIKTIGNDYISYAQNATTALQYHIDKTKDYYDKSGITSGFTIDTGTGSSAYGWVNKYYEQKSKLESAITSTLKNYANSGLTLIEGIGKDDYVTLAEKPYLRAELNRIQQESASTASIGDSLINFTAFSTSYYGAKNSISDKKKTYTASTKSAQTAINYFLNKATAAGYAISNGTGASAYSNIAKYYEAKSALEKEVNRISEIHARFQKDVGKNEINNEYEYLKNTFGAITDNSGVTLSRLLGVHRDNKLKAFMNGSNGDMFKISGTNGNDSITIAAGIPAITGSAIQLYGYKDSGDTIYYMLPSASTDSTKPSNIVYTYKTDYGIYKKAGEISAITGTKIVFTNNNGETIETTATTTENKSNVSKYKLSSTIITTNGVLINDEIDTEELIVSKIQSGVTINTPNIYNGMVKDCKIESNNESNNILIDLSNENTLGVSKVVKKLDNYSESRTHNNNQHHIFNTNFDTYAMVDTENVTTSIYNKMKEVINNYSGARVLGVFYLSSDLVYNLTIGDFTIYSNVDWWKKSSGKKFYHPLYHFYLRKTSRSGVVTIDTISTYTGSSIKSQSGTGGVTYVEQKVIGCNQKYKTVTEDPLTSGIGRQTDVKYLKFNKKYYEWSTKTSKYVALANPPGDCVRELDGGAISKIEVCICTAYDAPDRWLNGDKNYVNSSFTGPTATLEPTTAGKPQNGITINKNGLNITYNNNMFQIDTKGIKFKIGSGDWMKFNGTGFEKSE